MRNKLQYAYSITVFVGVLLTAYLMMNRDGNAHIPFRSFEAPATLRTEAQVLDPGLNQLFETETALTRNKSVVPAKKRAISDSDPDD